MCAHQLVEMSLEESNQIDDGAEETLEAIAVLIDRLKDEDASLRALSNSKLSVIGRALGPERTREELVPFLVENTEDSDEVLSAMAGELGALVDCVGQDYVMILLEPIEALALVEDSHVREKAVNSALSVATALDENRINSYYLDFVRRLATHDWFTGRISACGVLGPVLTRTTNHNAREEAKHLFARLCRDDTPMVRRVAAAKLGEIASQWQIHNEHYFSTNDDCATVDAPNQVMHQSNPEPQNDDLESLITLFTALAEDEQDSVRLQTPRTCVQLANCIVSNEKRCQVALPAILKAVADRSWRVRWSVACDFDSACSTLDGCQDQLCSAIIELLNDVELEVRVAAAKKAGAVALALAHHAHLKILLQNSLLPAVEALANDIAPQVRSALAAALGSLARAAGSEDAHTRIFPLILDLLQDSSSEVRLALISHLAELHDVLGDDLVASSLIPAIIDLARDSKWRVRAAVITRVPKISAQLRHNTGSIDQRLSTASFDWLQDEVDTVRELASANLFELAKLMGPQWSAQNVNTLCALCDESLYLRRVTALKVIKRLAHLLPTKILAERILAPVLRLAASDKVPNVRFNAIVTLPELAAALKNYKLPDHLALSTRPYLDSTLYTEEQNELYSIRSSAYQGSDHDVPVVGDKRHRRLIAPSDDDDDGDIKMTDPDSDYDASYAHFVANDILPTLQHIAADDPDADVRDFALQAKNLIVTFS
uniref:Phosphatase PP2A regulatory subunit A/Splicing factor 3B subunit 1-like HEAT repeat domain-containing protein n=1 Tax=Aureoumbra lagunensis TaxID=44058 RepID=A0A7S3NPV1_9STRA|mmetsp:Transcript_20362/g.26396  ORF Transcript_20362/g.26396 Transcript_20362/m.26396 type:complete len:718 (-) Transcript_20362:176-2329(-)|eukprot:CAMPEP_0197315184 /NCGR_PEP_ID=MMETSP0891-20130614/37129_1 /TAXON_ID=44058 ORGANISM="Aureoumbra lagunensis, Strain CCMP1510" /NCGR_SAMPLE_ID=MMETSP0891 /ASSEMBLY_ACC=CAM_ASM_000534 /LENGTH=717 /DNA_ID=CAMNT_0042804015 /DNA_START=1 /DNA_END=2154 /DNA_ORIENTATION=+